MRTRYDCPFGCGWHRDEDAELSAEEVTLTSVVTIADAINAAISVRVEQRERVFRGHLDQAHPGWTMESARAAATAQAGNTATS